MSWQWVWNQHFVRMKWKALLLEIVPVGATKSCFWTAIQGGAREHDGSPMRSPMCHASCHQLICEISPIHVRRLDPVHREHPMGPGCPDPEPAAVRKVSINLTTWRMLASECIAKYPGQQQTAGNSRALICTARTVQIVSCSCHVSRVFCNALEPQEGMSSNLPKQRRMAWHWAVPAGNLCTVPASTPKRCIISHASQLFKPRLRSRFSPKLHQPIRCVPDEDAAVDCNRSLCGRQ